MGAALLSTALVVQLWGAPAAEALRYERLALENGEWWRLATAHLVHLGWAHLALNALAFAGLAALLGGVHGIAGWSWVVAASALAVSLGLLVAVPEVAWYVGLSGVAHGVAAAGGVALASRGRPSGWVWLGLVALKLAVEQGGSSLPTEALIGPVVTAAHGFGAVGGLVAALALELARRRQRG